MIRQRKKVLEPTSSAAHDEELTGYVEALSTVAERMTSAGNSTDVIQSALDVIRDAFQVTYASCWWIDPKDGVLKFRQESGTVSPEFRNVTLSATFARGVGLAGRVWQQRQLVFAPDLSEVRDCVRAPVASRSGILSAVAFPLIREGEVVGTMDFMADPNHTPGPVRQSVLGCAGKLVSQALERVLEGERRSEMEHDMAAINAVVREIAESSTEEQAIKSALDTTRKEFGWEYGSFWALDLNERVLRNSLESGSAGEEFRRVTREATFAEGVGVAGRAWRSRDMVFEPDLGVVSDCVRAPAAQRAGVKSGVCLPIIVHNDVVGTMDFFTTKDIVLTQDRERALRNTAFLVSNAIERHRAQSRTETAGQELLSSITEVERNVLEASNVAADAQRLTEEASKIVNSLNTSSVEIGNVVKVITSIAEQTNLLALNATIEAARAGDAGKGFAVVANEVKDLARETAKATEEVDSKVSAIQSDAGSVVHALQGVAQTVERINEAQNIISGVLTEQSAVTRSVLGA
ncbi:methyl-accepting chemotaxis protein [Agilicoccus flavus]|uniref:methyl-accepting chemotaxis protein n=1 Tax=Agilicoccus flavus TaxID=2775968 RepID=UPI001CF7089C|nr:methyl-accepting chemotaxis protein [Agilicoccus flavus]